MPLHVVHRDEWLVPYERERFCEIYADPKRRFEAEGRGDRYRVYLGWLAFGNEFEKCF